MDKKQQLLSNKLVMDYQLGDAKALPDLVRIWHRTFCEKAYWLVKDADAAKDIAQESWSTIIKKLKNLNRPESFGSWASRIVYNKSLDWINDNNKIQNYLKDYKYQLEVQNLESSDNEFIKAQLLKTIKTLPLNQQMVIQLFYVEDYSLNEIGDILGISVGTAKSRLFYARERLKQILKNRNYGN